MAEPTLGSVALRLSAFVDEQISRDAELRAWASGTATGGPEGDGRYPITDPLGGTTLLLCPAAFAVLVGGAPAAAILASINVLAASISEGAASALANAAAAEAARLVTDTLRAQAQAARSDAVNAAANAAAYAASIPALSAQVTALQTSVDVLEGNKANQAAFDALILRVIALETGAGAEVPIIYPGLDFRDARNSMYL